MGCINKIFFSYVNPASYIENDNFVNDDFDSMSDDLNYDDSLVKPPSYTRVSRINISPEAEKKRKEAYEKWLKTVKARERERKRMQKEREEAMLAKKIEEEESKKAANDEKIKEWMKKKELEAQKKLTRLNELKKRSSDIEVVNRKTKDFKKAIDFKQWLEKKNDEHKEQKRIEEERKKLQKDYRVCRESTSAALYSKWKESSRKTPKPVPMNRGLESLRGSTTKIFVNPIAWKSLDE